MFRELSLILRGGWLGGSTASACLGKPPVSVDGDADILQIFYFRIYYFPPPPPWLLCCPREPHHRLIGLHFLFSQPSLKFQSHLTQNNERLPERMIEVGVHKAPLKPKPVK